MNIRVDKIGRPFFEMPIEQMERLALPRFLDWDWLIASYRTPCMISIVELRRIEGAAKQKVKVASGCGAELNFSIGAIRLS